MAKIVAGRRYYLPCALPRKPNEEAAYADGKKAAREGTPKNTGAADAEGT